MSINDELISRLTTLLRQEVEKAHLAQRDGNYLSIIRAASMIEDAGRQIGWRALELEKEVRYLAR